MSLTPFVQVAAALDALAVGDAVPLSTDERHHLRRVLRLPDGAAVEVADGRGTHAAAELHETTLRVTGEVRTTPVARPELWVAQALPKGRRADEVIRQVTELGADGVAVVAAQRSVARLNGDRAIRARGRWEAVARAACEQARRPRRPVILGPLPAAELPTLAGTLLVAHPGAPPLPTVLGAVTSDERVTIAIGPEGGWADAELTALETSGAHLVGLGPTVLRTEHAAAAALAVVAAGVGRWGR